MTLKGIYPIVPPLFDNGEIDYASIEQLIDCMAEKKGPRTCHHGGTW